MHDFDGRIRLSLTADVCRFKATGPHQDTRGQLNATPAVGGAETGGS